MLKSLLVKLRRKPKVVREQVALVGAGVFTFIVFVGWAFTVPARFSDSGDTQSAGLFSTLKDEISEGAPDLGEIADDFREVVATTSEELSENSEEVIFEESTIEIDLDSNLPDPTKKTVRIATTSSFASSSEEQNMVE